MIASDKVSEIIGYVAATEVGHWIAWNFLTENWLVLSERYEKNGSNFTCIFSPNYQEEMSFLAAIYLTIDYQQKNV